MADLLLIDDDPQQCELLALLLRREGHDAVCVNSASAALTHLRHAEPEPDLILLDLTMPGIDGLDLLDAITEEPRFAHLPVAVYSGRDDPESHALAQRLGARDYIVKG